MPVDEAIQRFIPLTVARGKLGLFVPRVGLWFGRDEPTEETVSSLVFGSDGLGIMALIVSDGATHSNALASAFPVARDGSRQRLRLVEIRDWGNEIESVLAGETMDGDLIAFFDTGYFAARDQYKVGVEYDFRLAGLIYQARCTNEETFEISDPKRIKEITAATGQAPECLDDGTLAPLVFHYAGCTGYAAHSEEYPEDAEFYCVIDEVSDFDLEGIRIYRITPQTGDDATVPLPRVIFGAASSFAEGYVPRPGDSIGGALWTQGFLEQTEPRSA